MDTPDLPQPLWRHAEFRRGLQDMTGTALGVAAWGLLTGIAMAKSELAMPLALLMSLIVFAGSAQLAALPLLASGAPLWVIWATALCVNLRFVIFSAGWRRYFGALPRAQRLRMSYFAADLNYALVLKRFPLPPETSKSVPYFWGGVSLNFPAWHVPSLIGLLVGDRIPTEWGLGFAGALALLALTYAMLHDRSTWIAAAVAGAAAVATFALPLRLNILVAIAAAVVVGLLIDHTTQRPARAGEDLT